MPRKGIDRSGQRYGRLIVLDSHIRKGGTRYWQCACDCGNILWVCTSNLVSGTQKSCGCLRREKWATGNRKTHGLTGTPLYAVWSSMKGRCYNPKNQDYDVYGGRGITVCDRWKDSFEFFHSDMAAKYRPGLSLERQEVNGNYEPSNCCWATMREQQNNRRNTRKIDSPWGIVTVRRGSELSGLPMTTINNRIFQKWPVAEIFGPRRWADGHR